MRSFAELITEAPDTTIELETPTIASASGIGILMLPDENELE